MQTLDVTVKTRSSGVMSSDTTPLDKKCGDLVT